MPALYVGPWVWVSDEDGERWQAPEDAVGLIDMRSTLQCGVAGGTPGLGLFAMRGHSPSVASGDYSRVCNDWSEPLDAQSRKALRRIVNKPLQGDDVATAVWDLLTRLADPLGESTCCPLMPSEGRNVRLMIGKQSRCEPHRFGKGDHDGPIRQVIREKIKEAIRLADGGRIPIEKVQQVVGYELDRLGLDHDDWRQIVPANLQAKIGRARKPETTYTDDFNRASLGANWTVLRGAATINGSTEYSSTNTSACRYVSALSGSDHDGHATVVLWASTLNVPRLQLRYHASDETCYHVRTRRDTGGDISRQDVEKLVTGTVTSLGSATGLSGYTSAAVHRMTVTGSALQSFLDGVSKVSLTDTSLTSGLYAGIGSTLAGRSDDWSASDIGGGGGILYTQLERGIRGVQRGTYTDTRH